MPHAIRRPDEPGSIRSSPAPCLSDKPVMITDPVVAAPLDCGGRVAPSGQASPGPDPSPQRLASWIRTLLVLTPIPGGIAFNAWWSWRDTRPVADLRMIEIWIGNREYGPARKELREHLRRAPHDGAARIMLARVLAARGNLTACIQELQQVPAWWPQKAE